MGYGLDAELKDDELDQLLVRLNRCHAAGDTRVDFVALMSEPDMTPALLARTLSRLEHARPQEPDTPGT